MNTETKRFKKINEGFDCLHCKKKVSPLKNGSCRNHCPFCLYSIHIDRMPGDRSEKCGGLMEPIGVEAESRRGQIIIYRCTRCGQIRRNKSALDDPIQPDSLDEIIRLMKEVHR